MRDREEKAVKWRGWGIQTNSHPHWRAGEEKGLARWREACARVCVCVCGVCAVAAAKAGEGVLRGVSGGGSGGGGLVSPGEGGECRAGRRRRRRRRRRRSGRAAARAAQSPGVARRGRGETYTGPPGPAQRRRRGLRTAPPPPGALAPRSASLQVTLAADGKVQEDEGAFRPRESERASERDPPLFSLFRSRLCAGAGRPPGDLGEVVGGAVRRAGRGSHAASESGCSGGSWRWRGAVLSRKPQRKVWLCASARRSPGGVGRRRRRRASRGDLAGALPVAGGGRTRASGGQRLRTGRPGGAGMPEPAGRRQSPARRCCRAAHGKQSLSAGPQLLDGLLSVSGCEPGPHARCPGAAGERSQVALRLGRVRPQAQQLVERHQSVGNGRRRSGGSAHERAAPPRRLHQKNLPGPPAAAPRSLLTRGRDWRGKPLPESSSPCPGGKINKLECGGGGSSSTALEGWKRLARSGQG